MAAGRRQEMSCKCAKVTDEYHGWECDITEGACMFLNPDSKKCAEMYGEGPDACQEEETKGCSGECDLCPEADGCEQCGSV